MQIVVDLKVPHAASELGLRHFGNAVGHFFKLLLRNA